MDNLGPFGQQSPIFQNPPPVVDATGSFRAAECERRALVAGHGHAVYTRRQVRQARPGGGGRVIRFGAGKGAPRAQAEYLATGNDDAVADSGRAEAAAGLVYLRAVPPRAAGRIEYLDGRQRARPALFSREVNIKIDDPILWDLDNPALYEVDAKLLDRKGAVVDVASTDFGMRKLEAKGPRIYLNDRPIYLFGGMDLMHVGMNIAPAYQHPTDEEIRHEIALAKELGFNFIRKVGCLEDPRYMYWADRLGMLLMLMPPCMHQVTEESLERWFDEWRALIIRDRNHPSAFIWAPFNESFGLYYDGNWDVLPGATARDIVERAYDEGKALDPTRPIIDNSNGHGLGHIKHDIDDGHPYYKLSQYENCKRHMANLRATNRPVVITEFNPHIMVPDLERLKAEWGASPGG